MPQPRFGCQGETPESPRHLPVRRLSAVPAQAGTRTGRVVRPAGRVKASEQSLQSRPEQASGSRGTQAAEDEGGQGMKKVPDTYSRVCT